MLLESYGAFYRGLTSEGVSWQEYLLDQVLRGVDSPFARAAAKLEAVDQMLPAVAHDLNALQALAVAETTLAGWCRDTGFNISEEWQAAASKLQSKQHSGLEDNFSESWSVDTIMDGTPAHVLAPLTPGQRAALRSAIASRWQWGEAASLLRAYHAAHDFGIVSVHSVLKWTGDRLQAQDVLEGVGGKGGQADDANAHAQQLTQHYDAFLSSDLSNRASGHAPIVLIGGLQEGYACAMACFHRQASSCTLPVQLAAAAAGVRLVLLPPSKLKDLPELAWTMSQHPRVRFMVLCPGVASEVDAGAATALMGLDGVSWPANALFVGCAREAPASFAAVSINI